MYFRPFFHDIREVHILARLYPLFSSSKGNATFIGTPKGGVLIDAGVTYRRLCMGLERCGLSLSAIQGVFITHDHSDHVRGLKTLTERLTVPIYGQGKTLRNLIDHDAIALRANLQEIGAASIQVADVSLNAFVTPHDTVQSCGYRIAMPDGKICAVCTDLGYVTRGVEEALNGCDLVLLEANYDEDLLREGKYPPYVKERILSKVGHLSNTDCAAQAKKLVQSGTTRLILGHLSQENNRPHLAEQAVVSALADMVRGQDYLLQVAKVETEGEMIAF